MAAAFADVFVGRAPVNDQEQADVFIDKILIYEKSAPSDYVNEVLFLAGPFGTCEDGETFPEHKEYLNATFLPDYIQLYRLYTPETFYVPKNPIYLPVFSYLDNAGVTESIIATYIKEENNTKVFVFSVDGNDFGNWPVEIEGKTKAVYAEDTDSDGYEEVYVLIEKSDRSTHVYGYDYQGNALPEWNDITILTDKLSISDMNGDAFNEIIYIDDDCYVHVLDSDRDELSGWPQQMALGGDYTGTDLCSLLIPVIKDPDADGNKELCIKSNGSASYKAEKVYCFNETGGPINAAWPLNLSEMGLGYFTRRLFFEDIDLDGEIEIAVNAFDGTDNIYTYVFERDGSVKAGWPQQITSNMILRLEDVWGDEKKEIIATKIIGSLDEVAPQTPDTIIIWKENGDILDGWPIDNVFATNLKIGILIMTGRKSSSL